MAHRLATRITGHRHETQTADVNSAVTSPTTRRAILEGALAVAFWLRKVQRR